MRMCLRFGYPFFAYGFHFHSFFFTFYVKHIKWESPYTLPLFDFSTLFKLHCFISFFIEWDWTNDNSYQIEIRNIGIHPKLFRYKFTTFFFLCKWPRRLFYFSPRLFFLFSAEVILKNLEHLFFVLCIPNNLSIVHSEWTY